MFSRTHFSSLWFLWLTFHFFSVESWEFGSRIIGGSSAVDKQFPYQVSIRDKQSGIHFCGGVIINHRFILTAAHCFFERTLDTDLIYGVINKTHASDYGTRVDFMTVIIHPEFGKLTAQPDICLLKSRERINFSENVSPVGLPTREMEPGDHGVISGWGSIKVHFET